MFTNLSQSGMMSCFVQAAAAIPRYEGLAHASATMRKGDHELAQFAATKRSLANDGTNPSLNNHGTGRVTQTSETEGRHGFLMSSIKRHTLLLRMPAQHFTKPGAPSQSGSRTCPHVCLPRFTSKTDMPELRSHLSNIFLDTAL